ncbi:MAG: ATP-dependent sacrificial sulfur transferase LarE [Chloroflexaceae bacterium]|nr:ATP-dependent sacrificial sulfur transferase LarE [Chloroflexaceae bacterium]
MALPQRNHLDHTELEGKRSHLYEIIASLESVAVAFQGGLTSTYLLAVCRDILGPANVLAVTTQSSVWSSSELAEARARAVFIGVPVETIETRELDNPAFVRNDRARCFYCKSELFASMQPLMQEWGLNSIVCEVIAEEDSGDYRLAMLAAQRYNVRAPLYEAQFTRDEIRNLARQRNLPISNRAAGCCLASRIPCGTPLTVEALDQVSLAEAFLRDELNLRHVRVRHHGNLAALEISQEDVARVVQPSVRRWIINRMRECGFTHVTLDLVGLRQEHS